MQTTQRQEKYFFRSKGPSNFIAAVSVLLKEHINNNWALKGNDSLVVTHNPTIEAIRKKFDKGLSAQIWMERPENGTARCKFEIAYKIRSLSENASKQIREKIAQSIRDFMVNNQLPNTVAAAMGSTVVACRLSLSRSNNSEDDFNIHNESDKRELQKVLEFYQFLNTQLDEWNNQNLISLINISS